MVILYIVTMHGTINIKYAVQTAYLNIILVYLLLYKYQGPNDGWDNHRIVK